MLHSWSTMQLQETLAARTRKLYTNKDCPSNDIDVEDSSDQHRSSLKKLIPMFSREDDWILDINSTQGMHTIKYNSTVSIIKYAQLIKF